MWKYACTAFSYTSKNTEQSLLGQKDQQALSVNATSHYAVFLNNCIHLCTIFTEWMEYIINVNTERKDTTTEKGTMKE